MISETLEKEEGEKKEKSSGTSNKPFKIET